MNDWIFPHFSPIIKVVSAGCNLRCKYCFYSGNQPEIMIMDEKVLGIVIDQCLSVAPNVSFVWHGGEPTIAGIKYYQQMLRLCNELKRPGQRVSHNIQTNGTLLDEEWADFMRNNRFSIGVSLDGPEHINNYTRVDANGRGAFSSTMRGVNILKNANVKFGVLAVINSNSVKYPDEIFSFMYSKGLSFSANPCTSDPSDPDSVRELAVSPMQYANFVLRLMDLWLKLEDPTFKVGPVNDLIKAVLGKQPRICRFKGNCKRYVTIDSSGEVYPCDAFLNSKHILGDLKRESLQNIVDNDATRMYYSGRLKIIIGCGDCEWLQICKGGCMRTWEGEKSITDPREYEFCQARQYLFQSVRTRLSEIGYKSSYKEKEND